MLGIISVVFGITPFLTGGWTIKIIVGIIVFGLWNTYAEASKTIKEMKEEMKELKQIEKRFIVNEEEVMLKN